MFPQAQESKRIVIILGWVVLVLFAIPAAAQLTVGDDVKLNLSGDLGFGYTGSFGTADSNHGQDLVGDAVLSGSYYHPNFISFSVRPYFDRTQSNALSQALAHDTGFDTNVNFFSGSRIPGSISFSKQFNTSSEFGFPGVPQFVTDGSGQAFQITWSEAFEKLPPITASYSAQSSSYTALGSSGENESSTKLLNLNTNYDWLGFRLQGNVSHVSQEFKFPDVFGLSGFGGGTSTTYGVNAQHRIPLHGGISLGFTRSNYSSDNNEGFAATANSATAGASVAPFRRLQLSSTVTYTSNVTAVLEQSLISSGASSLIPASDTSRAIQINGTASYLIGRGLTANGHVDRTSVTFAGRKFDNTQYGGTVNYRYNQRLLGMLYFNVGVIDTINKEGNTGLGAVGTVGMNRKFGAWETAADFNYSQDTRTLYGIATTSNLAYGGSLRRRVNQDFAWGASARTTHSALVQIDGTSASSTSYSSNLSYRRYGVSGTYIHSNGTSVLTSAGLITPVPGAPLVTDDFVLFNARSLGIGGSAFFIRRLTVSGSYSKVHSDIDAKALHSFNEANVYAVRTDYRIRKLTVIGGYTRIDQGSTAINNGTPTVVNSFYLSISRWFNIF